MNTATASPPTESSEGPHVDHEMDHEMAHAASARLKMGWGQRAVVALLLTVVIAPPLAGFYSYFSGVPLHLVAAKKDDDEKNDAAATAPAGIALVVGKAYTVQVSDDVAKTLGIRKGDKDAVSVAHAPSMMRPLVLPGSTALDPTRLARIRARFAPARVVEIAHIWSRKNGPSEHRELRQGDHVSKGDLLGLFYSVDVGSKKNDLLEALVQLELDQRIMDRYEQNRFAIPEVLYLTEKRALQGDRTEVSRALNNLKAWDIPQEEIDALHAEAKKISADEKVWSKTPEGRWVKGEDLAKDPKIAHQRQEEDPWGKVALRAPFAGVIVERNLHVDEMVVDNTVNLFQIADVSRLLVVANCPEDALPTLEAMKSSDKRWTVQTVGVNSIGGLSGFIDEIGYVIDPNQHTAIIKGYVDNPGQHIRAGQYVTATVNIPPPPNVVEIAVDALVDDGRQSLVFVQPDPAKHEFTMRRVQVTHRFDHSVFVRSSDIPREEQLTATEAEEGLLPKEPIRPGDRVLLAGPVELKRVVLDLESRSQELPAERLAKTKLGSTLEIETPAPSQRAGKG